MGQELYQIQPVFQQAIDVCASHLNSALGFPLTDLLFKASYQEQLMQVRYEQPALFSYNYAMACLWQSLGIKPCYILGYGVGEVAAAVISS